MALTLDIIAVGRLGRGEEARLIEAYRRRIDAAARAAGVGPLAIKEIDDRRHRGAAQEADLLLGGSEGARRVLLDERGSALDSRGFAELLGRWRDDGARRAAFLIGGADGHGAEARAAADATLSLGVMTWPHALARVMLAEQIYRAQTILLGHPYHRDGP